MADPDIVEIACARAWGVYLLINRGIAVRAGGNAPRRASHSGSRRRMNGEDDPNATFAIYFMRTGTNVPQGTCA